jgi:hypothetical protein
MASVNGTFTPIDLSDSNVTPIIVSPGRVMIPFRFIADQLGCDVNWNATQQTVTMTYPNSQ